MENRLIYIEDSTDMNHNTWSILKTNAPCDVIETALRLHKHNKEIINFTRYIPINGYELETIFDGEIHDKDAEEVVKALNSIDISDRYDLTNYTVDKFERKLTAKEVNAIISAIDKNGGFPDSVITRTIMPDIYYLSEEATVDKYPTSAALFSEVCARCIKAVAEGKISLKDLGVDLDKPKEPTFIIEKNEENSKRITVELFDENKYIFDYRFRKEPTEVYLPAINEKVLVSGSYMFKGTATQPEGFTLKETMTIIKDSVDKVVLKDVPKDISNEHEEMEM